MIGQELRLHDIILEDNKALIVNLTAGLYGVEYQNVGELLVKITQLPVDAVILSSGEARRHFTAFKNKKCPALIIRCDYTNYRLDDQSVYPAQKFRHVLISSATEALRLGASAIIIDAFFGVSDDDNAQDLQFVRQLAEESSDVGIPLIVNSIPHGSRVNDKNFEDISLLGTRLCLELGTGIVTIPVLSESKCVFAKESSLNSPIFVIYAKSSMQNSIPPIQEVIQRIEKTGLNGIILDGFQPLDSIPEIANQLHRKLEK